VTEELPVGENMDMYDPVGEVGDITKTSGKTAVLRAKKFDD
jgi:hypothetical protein